MASSIGSSSTISTDKPTGVYDNTAYDPASMDGVNLSDPEELEAHLQVLDVRLRLRQKRRKAIQCFTACFIVVVVSLLAGMGFNSKEGKENAQKQKDSDQQNGGDLASTGTDTKLPQPPADLASKCSLTTLNTPQGISVCEGACEVAECCDVPDGYALSCIAANDVICAEYQRYCDILHNLPSAGFVPPVQDQTAPTPPPISDEALKVQIDTACVDVEADILLGSSCMGICREGFCCFDGSSNCDFNCQTYFNCNAAYQAQANQPVSAPTPMTLQEEINQLCGDHDVEAINPPGENTCEHICSMSFCCFNHLCVAPADIECLDYSGCYVLYTDLDTVDDDESAGSNPTLTEEVHTACFTAGNINDAAASTECTTLCAPGACCFQTNLECAGVDCETYAECNILYPQYIAVTKQEVEDACNNHNDNAVQAGQPTLCEQVCTLHVLQCCFHENGDCDDALQNADSLYCDTYQACEVLGTNSDSLRDSHKAELEAACSDLSSRSQCIKLCAAALCCHSNSIKEECANVDVSITCTDYQACDVLYANGT